MIPRFIRLFSVPILLGWLALTVLVNVIAPQLEKVGEAHAVSLAPNDAPSMQAMQRIGKTFQEFDSNSSAMIVLEGDQPLSDAAHKYYDGLIDKLEADKKHVEHIQDFWGDPLTASGAQSADGKAAYVQVYLAGNQGETLANESVQAVRDIVDQYSAATGDQGLCHRPRAAHQRPAPRRRQQHQADHDDHHRVIFVMLLFVYRSIVTVLLVLVMMFIELAAARGIVAALGYYDLIGLSTFAVNLLTTLAIAAGTDYAIFLVGRYHEARDSGRGSRNRVLHDVSRHRPRHSGFGSDHRGRDVLPALHEAALLPNAGHSVGDRHARRCRGGADHGARSADHLQSVRPVRSRSGRRRLAAGAASVPP